VALIDVNSMGVGDVPSEIGNIPNQRVFLRSSLPLLLAAILHK
jgi:hypothetical protein